MVLIGTGCIGQEKQEESLYMGQQPPGNIPEIFAPGIISRPDDMEYACTFSQDGKTIYYSLRKSKTGMPSVYTSTLTGDVWSEPVPLDYEEAGILFEPHMTYDGSCMYFTGKITETGGSESKTGIWKRTYDGEEWSGLSFVIEGMYASTSIDGSVYMTDISTNTGIVELKYDGDDCIGFETLTGGINQPVPGIHPCISPDKSYMIYDCEREDGFGGEGDLYVSFNNGDGTWSDGYNLGADVNSEGVEFTASFSPDGKYIFFMKDYDLYWVSSEIIAKIRNEHLSN